MIYTVALKRWLKSRVPDFDFEKHFGGVIYVFLRGARSGSSTGIFRDVPPIGRINDLDNAMKA
jgi:exodeoxyribonuclease V beta subunit